MNILLFLSPSTNSSLVEFMPFYSTVRENSDLKKLKKKENELRLSTSTNSFLLSHTWSVSKQNRTGYLSLAKKLSNGFIFFILVFFSPLCIHSQWWSFWQYAFIYELKWDTLEEMTIKKSTTVNHLVLVPQSVRPRFGKTVACYSIVKANCKCWYNDELVESTTTIFHWQRIE